jgi:hypothetical protein
MTEEVIGDAALLLHGHPVAGGVREALAGLDGAREVDWRPVEQQLLGQRRLAGVGVRDDGEGTPGGDFAFEAALVG